MTDAPVFTVLARFRTTDTPEELARIGVTVYEYEAEPVAPLKPLGSYPLKYAYDAGVFQGQLYLVKHGLCGTAALIQRRAFDTAFSAFGSPRVTLLRLASLAGMAGAALGVAYCEAEAVADGNDCS